MEILLLPAAWHRDLPFKNNWLTIFEVPYIVDFTWLGRGYFSTLSGIKLSDCKQLYSWRNCYFMIFWHTQSSPKTCFSNSPLLRKIFPSGSTPMTHGLGLSSMTRKSCMLSFVWVPSSFLVSLDVTITKRLTLNHTWWKDSQSQR